MKKSKIAVVFPIFNGAKTMVKSLRCIAEQDYEDFCVIIVDNCSTDETHQIAQSFCEEDKRFRLQRNKAHISAVDNYLLCMDIGRKNGEYFCLRACDDLSSSNYLSSLANALDQNPEKLLAGPTVRRVNAEATRKLHPDPIIFGYPAALQRGDVPRSLAFPAEWCYGMFRSTGGSDILIQRWREYPYAWCVASYAVSEFVMRGLAIWVEDTEYIFVEGSGSYQKYGAKTLFGKFWQRLQYTLGCLRVAKKIPRISTGTKIKLFRRLWRDSRIKTRYDLEEHFLRLIMVRK
jgi:glycosyltransferase involved in cell wall biosynthesis